MGGYLGELFSVGLYKRNQGRVARQATLIALGVVAAAGAWLLRGWMEGEGYGTSAAVLVPLGVFAGCCWAAFRWVQLPKFADFLISVEAEMNKVSWPARGELWKASLVVIVTIFLLAILLFGYDLIWKEIIGTLMGDKTGISGFFGGLFGGGEATGGGEL